MSRGSDSGRCAVRARRNCSFHASGLKACPEACLTCTNDSRGRGHTGISTLGWNPFTPC